MPLAQIIIGDLVPPRGTRAAPGLDRHRVRRHQRARAGAGRVDDRPAVLALDLLHQPAGRRAWRCTPSPARCASRVARTRTRIDYLGSVLLTVAITALLLVLALGGTEWPWDAPQIKVCAALALVLGAWLLLHLRRAAGAGAAARPVRQPRVQRRQPRDGADLHGPDGRQRVLPAVLPAGDGREPGALGHDDGGDDGRDDRFVDPQRPRAVALGQVQDGAGGRPGGGGGCLRRAGLGHGQRPRLLGDGAGHLPARRGPGPGDAEHDVAVQNALPLRGAASAPPCWPSSARSAACSA